jgi:hypothetical protein
MTRHYGAGTRNREPNAAALFASGRRARRCRRTSRSRLGTGRLILAGLVAGSVLGAVCLGGGSAEFSSFAPRQCCEGEASPKTLARTELGRLRVELRPPIAYEAAGPPLVTRLLSRPNRGPNCLLATRRPWIRVGRGWFWTLGAGVAPAQRSRRPASGTQRRIQAPEMRQRGGWRPLLVSRRKGLLEYPNEFL